MAVGSNCHPAILIILLLIAADVGCLASSTESSRPLSTTTASNDSSGSSPVAGPLSPSGLDDEPDDEDVVISSSEILASTSELSPPARGGPRDEPQRYGSPSDAAVMREIDRGGAGESAGKPAPDSHRQEESTDSQQYSSSRFLLRFLVVGLFGCVSCSLIVVYGIKFCVSRRRRKRRLLRRNLVADLSRQIEAAERARDLAFAGCLAPQCSCSEPSDERQPAGLSRLHALLRPSLWPFWPAGGPSEQQQQQQQQARRPSPALPSIYHQLALQHLAASDPTTSAAHCQACQSVSNHYQAPGCPLRPPAYTELFGLQQSRSEAISLAAYGGSSQPASDQVVESEPSSSSPTAGQQQHQLQQMQQQRGSLLVKLSLNKTKVLSADDLVLLSKLIDVPIVVHQDQQQQQQPVVMDEQLLLSANRLMPLDEQDEEANDEEPAAAAV